MNNINLAAKNRYFLGSRLPQRRQIQELTCLYEVTRALSSTLNLKNALARVLEIMEESLGMIRGTICILKPESPEVQIEVAHGISRAAQKKGRYRLGEGITGTVVETGEPIIIPNISQDPRFLNKTGSHSKGDGDEPVSFICVPIKHGKRAIGALSVDRIARDAGSLEDDLRLLTVISSILAQSVVRLQEMMAERKHLLSENRKLKRALAEKYQFENIIGNSSQMLQVFEMVHRVAESKATVLLRGESGTGKSMIAKAIHFNSPQATGPFISVNCSALPENLIESELFGHERGAFTGATSMKKGRFELAHKGTLFLDEIGELPHSVQVKLLNVIQEREFQRVGGTKTVKVDVRIIAATNKNLEHAMEQGEFREDLYYRLNVFPIYLPPLRERKSDIVALAEYFLQKFSKEYGKEIRQFSSAAIDCLMQSNWPGNVRELQNCIERAVIVCSEPVLRVHHLPQNIQCFAEGQDSRTKGRSFQEAVENFEKEMIVEALMETRGNQTKAAKLLNTSLRIINYKIKKYGIDPAAYKGL